MKLNLKSINGTLIACDEKSRVELAKFSDGREIEVEFKNEKKRTNQQRKALEVYCKLVAEALTDAGLDMRRTLKAEIDIPWSQSLVKEFIWKPVQKVILDVESTTEPHTNEYNAVFEVVHRHLAQNHGVTVLWPTKFGQEYGE